MENISSIQLSKYESILKEIEDEFKKNEKLKKQFDNEVNKLIATRIALEENFTKENVFRVMVKVFNSVFDLFYIYGEEINRNEFELLRITTNSKYYLIEVRISKLFQTKIVSQKWWLNVCVRNSKMCVNKNIIISKNQLTNRIFVVIPFDVSTETSIVTCQLFMWQNNVWSSIKLSTTKIDISYHFALKENSHKDESNKLPLVLQPLPNKVEYNFKCKCTTKHFFESIVKNCYHRLNSQTFTSFSKPNIVLNFVIEDEEETQISLNKSEDVLSVSSNVQDLYCIKQYLIEEINCQELRVDKVWFVSLMNLKAYLRKELSEVNINLENIRIIYEELRKIIFELVV